MSEYSSNENRGRPPIDFNQRKSEVIRIRLSKEDIESIKYFSDRTEEEGLSTTIRSILFSKNISVRIRNIEIVHPLDDLKKIRSFCNRLLSSKRKDIEAVREEITELLKMARSLDEKLSPCESGFISLKELTKRAEIQTNH